MVGKILKEAKMEGFFSNHSLRRTGTTGLFQAGVDRKIIKEYTGHVSDAVDIYQITSEHQKENLRKIISGSTVNKPEPKVDESDKTSVEISVKNVKEHGVKQLSCSCLKKNIDIEKTQEIGALINDIISARKSGKTKIKLEIEFGELVPLNYIN